MAAILKAASISYKHAIKEHAVPYADEFFMMKTPWPILGIAIFYVYFVLKLGPQLMKNRPAFNIDRIVNIYNLLQIGLCITIIFRVHDPMDNKKFPWFNHYVEYNDTPYGRAALGVTHDFFLLKVFDLMDTVFFVLRKKNNQITFLHVYHHVMMAVFGWIITKFFPGGHVAFLGYINCYVHTLMYSYYFVTSMWPEYKKNVWWKKYVTQIQMIQFALNVIHSFPLLIMKEIQYPRFMAFLIFTQNILMLVMFYDFYRKAYSKKKDK